MMSSFETHVPNHPVWSNTLKLGELLDIDDKDRSPTDSHLDRIVRHDRSHLAHMRQRTQDLAALPTHVVNQRFNPRYLVILDPDDHGGVAFTQEAPGRGKLRRAQTAFTQRRLQLGYISILNDGNDKFHSPSLARVG
jgi:hypothetical protein